MAAMNTANARSQELQLSLLYWWQRSKHLNHLSRILTGSQITSGTVAGPRTSAHMWCCCNRHWLTWKHHYTGPTSALNDLSSCPSWSILFAKGTLSCKNNQVFISTLVQRTLHSLSLYSLPQVYLFTCCELLLIMKLGDVIHYSHFTSQSSEGKILWCSKIVSETINLSCLQIVDQESSFHSGQNEEWEIGENE